MNFTEAGFAAGRNRSSHAARRFLASVWQAPRGKPHGAAFFQLYAAIGQGKDQPLSAAREVGLFTKNPVVVPHMEEDNGKQAVYWGRWISPTGKAGEWSEPATMAIAA